jgi:hypothetical protein
MSEVSQYFYYETLAASSGGFFHSLLCAAALSADFVDRCARDDGFTLRRPRKISIHALLAALCEQSLHGTVSYNDLAAALDAAEDSPPSRQAVAARMTLREFFRRGQWPHNGVQRPPPGRL